MYRIRKRLLKAAERLDGCGVDRLLLELQVGDPDGDVSRRVSARKLPLCSLDPCQVGVWAPIRSAMICPIGRSEPTDSSAAVGVCASTLSAAAGAPTSIEIKQLP